MDPDEDFGWTTDRDIYGNVVSRPNLAEAAVYIEILCNGRMPHLEWKSPGRRCFPTPLSGSTLQQPQQSQPGPQSYPAPKLDHFQKLPSSISGPIKNVAPMSPFDFDDNESSSLSRAATILPPPKLEPRKRVIGTLTNALQAVQSPEKMKNIQKSLPSSLISSTESQSQPSSIAETTKAPVTGNSAQMMNPPGPVHKTDFAAPTSQELMESTTASESVSTTGISSG